MSSSRVRWLLFLGCGAVLTFALAVVTGVALEMEESGREERLRNERLQLQHVALARMDSALTTILAREAARPWFHYLSFFEPGPAYTAEFRPVNPQGILVASPLLRAKDDLFQLHFQVTPDGELHSPSVLAGELRDVARERGLLPDDADARAARLERLRGLVGREQLLAALERLAPRRRPLEGPEERAAVAAAGLEDPEAARRRAMDEFRFRSRLMAYANAAEPEPGARPVRHGGFVPLVVGGELLFAREVRVGEERLVQGLWADWPALERFLTSQVRDLYPDARLRPAAAEDAGDPETPLLAAVPFVFEPGPQPEPWRPRATPTRVALAGLWVAVLAAGGAVALTLRKTLELSERRRGFVSAVTHELRTPLTTFCMYSEMLADGMVTDPAARDEYLRTLKEESVRLRRIVDNVLSYARLEGRRATPRREVLPADELLDRVLPLLERRAAEGGMELVLDVADLRGVDVEVDPQAVEQVLQNLVDNACKYAAEAADRRVHLEAREAGALVLTVLDHGPGVPPGRRGEVFRPFRRATSGGAPGVGLGLALARGMARAQGGDVRLVDRPGYGAAFEVRLPRLGRGS